MKISEKVDMRDKQNVVVARGLSREVSGILVFVAIMVTAAILAIAGGILNDYAQANATPVLLRDVKVSKTMSIVRSGKSDRTVTNTVIKGYTKSGKYVVTTLIDNKTPFVIKSGKNSLSTTIYKDDLNRYFATK